jgi:bromodomain and PHD finger-containing protein 1
MELLKRARFGLEKLRLLCERVLRREKFKRQETELQAELWTLQMAGLDDGGGSDGRGGAEASGSPPPTPRRLRVYMTPTSAAQANTTLPPGFSYQVVAKPTKPSPSRPRARE